MHGRTGETDGVGLREVGVLGGFFCWVFLHFLVFLRGGRLGVVVSVVLFSIPVMQCGRDEQDTDYAYIQPSRMYTGSVMYLRYRPLRSMQLFLTTPHWNI